MTDDKKPLSRPGGTVKQQFARGKTVNVSVETKKKAGGGLLNIKKPALGKPAGVSKPSGRNAAAIDSAALIGKKTAPAPVAEAPVAAPVAPKPVVSQTRLSSTEQDARMRALTNAQAERGAREEQMRVQEDQRRAREEAQAAREAEERAREEAKQQAEVAATQAAERSTKVDETRTQMQTQAAARTGGDPLAGGRIKQAKKPEPARQPAKKTGGDRRKGRLTIAEALAGDEERQRSIASVKRRREKEKAKSDFKEKVFFRKYKV